MVVQHTSATNGHYGATTGRGFMQYSAEWLIVAWLAVVGGIIGSFLNVVVYRLPQGMSLIDPPSHCPKCKHLIRWFDNVPVLGWIMRRGRCRHCRNPISIRYPVVEAITAAIFGLLVAVEYLSVGANLLPRPVEIAENLYVTGWSTQQLYGIYLYHVLLLCTLLCTALIEIDGHQPPWRLFVPALVVGLAAPLVWPALRPVPAFVNVPNWLAGAVDGLAGLAAGAALGGIIWWALRQRKHTGLLWGLSGVGLFLGWQAVTALAVTTLAIHLPLQILGRILPKLRVPPSVWLAGLTLLWILFWARLVSGGRLG